MKISKKALMKILIEVALSEKALMHEQEESGEELGSSETDAGLLQYLKDLGTEQLQSVVSAGEQATGIDIDRDGDIDSDESGSDTDTEPDKSAEPAKAAKPKIKKSTKTEYIQNVLQMAGAYPTKSGHDDGQWGEGTTDAWKEWLKKPDTLEKFEALVKEKNAEQAPKKESRELFDLFSKIISEAEDTSPPDSKVYNIPDDLKTLFDDGAAAPIAAYFGLKPNLSGVEQLVKKLENVEVSEEEEADPEVDEEEADPEVDEEEVVKANDQTRLNTKIKELSIPANAKYFKMKGPAFTSKNPRRTIDIDINNPKTWEGQKKYITEDGKLKIFKKGEPLKKMFFNQNDGEIIIGKGGRDIKIFPVKLENSFVVPRTPDTTVQESLSRGSLIRKRYWGRY